MVLLKGMAIATIGHLLRSCGTQTRFSVFALLSAEDLFVYALFLLLITKVFK